MQPSDRDLEWYLSDDKTLIKDRLALKIQICHTCDNPPCVNFNHLFKGTALDNTNDMIAKGRKRQAMGELNAIPKLRESDIPLIFRMYADGYSQRAIAEIVGVSQMTIWSILHRRDWKHVPI